MQNPLKNLLIGAITILIIYLYCPELDIKTPAKRDPGELDRRFKHPLVVSQS
jgi:hypothetical protein